MDNRETSCRNRHYPQGGRKKRKRPSAYGDSRNRRDAGKRKNGNKAAWNHEKRERSKGLSTVKMTNAFQVRIRLSYRDLVYLPAEKKGHPDMHNASETELIELLKDTIEYLKKENESLKEEKAGFLAQIQEPQQTTVNLNETVEYLKRKLFGRSREKQEDPDQMKFDFFNEAEAEADPSVPEPTEEEVIEGYTRKRKGKQSRDGIYGDIPVQEVLCSMAEEDKKCPLCGAEMEYVGKRFVREELQIIPAKVKRIRYYQEVYACPKCKDEDEELVTEAAETPTPLLKHSLASPSTVAWIMYQKYAMYIPFYRLEQDWREKGIRLYRATMANWIIYCSQHYLKPVYERLHEYLVRRDILHADEVPCQVLKEPGRPAQSKSYMWIYLTGDDGEPGIVLYDYKPGRKGEYAREFLKGFHGYVHCDGYSGYNTPEDIWRVGCYAHLRRKFFDAIPAKKAEGSPVIPAEVGVAYCDKLFLLERIYKGKSTSEKYRLRLEHEKPIVDALYQWIDTLNPVKGSKLATAVTYAKNQRESLENFFKDGRLELSNSAAERRAKCYVMGRKNFLFHDTVDGAEASAIIYSLVETARENGLNIYQYLYLVLLYMPDYQNEPDGIEDMMPWSEFMRARCSKVDKIEKEMEPKK